MVESGFADSTTHRGQDLNSIFSIEPYCMPKPLVSVIIPSFNRSKYILEAIESVEGQTYGEFEIIVVDDGSSDGSFEILRDIEAQGRISLFTHPCHENLGQSSSINLGLRNASGNYIAILDSDDYFSPQKLEVQVAFLEKNQDVGMVYGQGHAVDETGRFLFALPSESHKEDGDPNLLLLDCYLAIPGGSLIRKTVFEAIGGFEEDFRASQDHDFALRVMEAFAVAYIPFVAFYYRKHADSISTKALETRWVTGLEILRRAKRRYPYRSETIRKRRAVIHFHMGKVHFSNGKEIIGSLHFLLAGFFDPFRAVRVFLGARR